MVTNSYDSTQRYRSTKPFGLKMPALKQIQEQWKKPQAWKVVQVDDEIEVCDCEGDFVMSTVTQDNVIEAVNEHREKVKTEAVMKLLLDLSDDHEA